MFYYVVGPQIISTMMLKSIIPYLTLLKLKLRKLWVRYQDSGEFNKLSNRTKQKTITRYVDIYSGPDLYLHFRYSDLMNQIFVTFTFGLGMPLLFPILLFSLINIYWLERYMFAYHYKKPRLSGSKLHRYSLFCLQFAPVFMMLFGYWQIGNR